ncbi:uncharacterized protein METZ01_LOCUS41236, partial [marine metagenome]
VRGRGDLARLPTRSTAQDGLSEHQLHMSWLRESLSGQSPIGLTAYRVRLNAISGGDLPYLSTR